MPKERDTLLAIDSEKKSKLDEKLGRNRMKLIADVKCPLCGKKKIIKKEINTADDIPKNLTADDLPLGKYIVYKCTTKDCTYEKKILINAEM